MTNQGGVLEILISHQKTHVFVLIAKSSLSDQHLSYICIIGVVLSQFMTRIYIACAVTQEEIIMR